MISSVLLLSFSYYSLTASQSGIDIEIEWENGQPRLTWPSADGVQFEVWSTTQTGDLGDWATVETLEATGYQSSWADPQPLTANRFYQVAYEVPQLSLEVEFRHPGEPNDLPDLETASFESIRSRLNELQDSGKVVLPIPLGGLNHFDGFQISGAKLYLDPVRETMVVSGQTILRGQAVDFIFIGIWSEPGSAGEFNIGAKFPTFDISSWISGLSGSILDTLNLQGSVISLSTEDFSLNPASLAGGAETFYGESDLSLRAGMNIYKEVDLEQAPRLSTPLEWLGFSDQTVLLEGYLGIDPNALFSPGGSYVPISMSLRAHLPVHQPAVFPDWLHPRSRILEFTYDPDLRIHLLDVLEASPDGQNTFFTASTEFDTSGNSSSVILSAGLSGQWDNPFGVDWLSFNDANLQITFSASGSSEVSLTGSFSAGNQTVSAELGLTDAPSGTTASVSASIDQITIGDVLELLSGVTNTNPFGDNLSDNALVLRDVGFSVDSAEAFSVSISGTTTILGTVTTEVLISFVEPGEGAHLLVMGMNIHDFKLSALYAGVDGTVAGDLIFPGAAFTIMQELPELPEPDLDPDDWPDDPEWPHWPDWPDGPIEIPSVELDLPELEFYEGLFGAEPFVLEMKAGVNFNGTFAQSKLPQVVLDALGMDPDAEILLKGGLGLRLGALSGGGLVALDSLNLQAVLPPPTRPRIGFPQWLDNLEPGERVIEFKYVDPAIEIGIMDTFTVELDGADRTFVTSIGLETNGQETGIILTGAMVSGWSQPFGISWLDLDSVGLSLTTNGTTSSASLHSAFELGGTEIALEMELSGGAGERQLRLHGAADTFSLTEFVDLVRRHVGTEINPFGDSNFEFSFSDVSLFIEAGSRQSFSLGGTSTLGETSAEILFSVIPQEGGGPAQIITGFLMEDWSLADALDGVQGTFVEDFRMDSVALVFSRGEGSADAGSMDPNTRNFYSSLFGTEDFNVPFENGLGLIGTVPLAGNPLNSGLDALGMSTDTLLLSGSIPGSIIGLGGGGNSGLDGLSLFAGLPPVSPPGGPDWFVEGQLALEITGQPSVGFVGSITVDIEGDLLTFSVSAAIQRVGPNVEFALAGELSAEEPWEQPFGIEWLIFNNAAAKVSVNAIGSITLGFAGDMVIGEKDIQTAVAVTVNATGVPTNFIFDGASEEGLEMADLVSLQRRMAQVGDPNAPVIPLDAVPEMAVRGLQLKFAPRGDPDLDVEAGFAISGDLWIPEEADGPPERNFAGVELSVDVSGIIAQGHLGAFELGPIDWEDAICDLELSLAEQHVFISGAAEIGSLYQGDLDLGVTRDSFTFLTSTELFGQFSAQLDASATFSFSDPNFTVHALMENSSKGEFAADIHDRVKTRALQSTAIANTLLSRGLNGWSSFRSNPHSLNFADRINGFTSAAVWPPPSLFTNVINTVQSIMVQIENLSLETPPNLLDLALGGHTVPGVPGVKTTICVERQWYWPFSCIRYTTLCNGLPYGGGDCWLIEPVNVPGACSLFAIPCSSTAYINAELIPPLISRIDTILVNQGRAPMVVVEKVEFTSSLDGLLSQPAVNLDSRILFMQANSPMDLSVDWDFSDPNASFNSLRDALINAL